MKRRYIMAAVLSPAVLGGLWAISQSEAGSLPYRDAETVDRGKALYAENCAACHGEELQGQDNWQTPGPDGRLPAPPHDATGHTWHHPDELLIAITELGSARVVGGGYESNMTGFGETMARGDIVAVLAYIKSTWPQEVIEIHNRINAEHKG